MALELQGLPEIEQDGKTLWFTDKTGEYDASANTGGWGSPNPELDQSALVLFIYRKSNPKTIVSAQVKHNANALNTDETTFSAAYVQDGVHDFNFLRLPVSSDNVQSIDTTPVVFTDGDYWYNPVEAQIKKKSGASVVSVDMASTTELDAMFAAITDNLLCSQLYYTNAVIYKNGLYNRMRNARRQRNAEQELQLMRDQMRILLDGASAAYQFSFGFKTEAQDTIETILDDYKLN